MTRDPPRLFDGEADEFERALLGSALSDTGSRASQARSISAMAAVLTTASAASAASGAAGALAAAGANAPGATGTPLTVAALAKWLGVGAVAGLAAATTTHQLSSPRVPEGLAVAPQAARAAPPGAVRPVPRAVRSPVAPPPSVAPVLAGADAPSVAPPASTLGAELRWLDVARTALEGGDPGAALEALDERDRRHRGGELGPEAAVLRVEALLARGDRAAARRVAEPWLSRPSSGGHRERMQGLLEQNP